MKFVAAFPEDVFNTLLLLERKRSERSGYPFGLALLDVTPETLPSISVRATDLVGWYRTDSILGIIFTSLNGTPIPVIRATLTSKIQTMVRHKVPFRLWIFPDDVNRDLYPETRALKPRSPFYIMKRIIDIGGSLSAIILLSPVFLAISIAVKLSSAGPVIFRQKRLGFFGREFDFLKFRTMYADNDPSIHKEYVAKLIEGGGQSSGVYKIRKDPRVTPIGRFLRKSSLDELPQFINVLRGEMSLVGPRPPIRYEVEKYQSWHKRRVLEVKPGLTGLWQVKGRSRTTFDEMVRLDLRYIQHQSLWLDLKILARTPLAVISGQGAC